jgi:integrase
LEAELGRPISHVFFYCTRGRSRRYGERIKSHYSAWKRACQRVGIDDIVLHDYRRTGSRNLTAAGVSPVAAKTITGHKTTAMFEHYSIGGTDVARGALRQLQDANTQQAQL